VFDGDEEAYREGMKTVAEKIVETGVTALVPTTIVRFIVDLRQPRN